MMVESETAQTNPSLDDKQLSSFVSRGVRCVSASFDDWYHVEDDVAPVFISTDFSSRWFTLPLLNSTFSCQERSVQFSRDISSFLIKMRF